MKQFDKVANLFMKFMPYYIMAKLYQVNDTFIISKLRTIFSGQSDTHFAIEICVHIFHSILSDENKCE